MLKLIAKLFGKPRRMYPHSFNIQGLPLELLLSIFDYPSIQDLCNFSVIVPRNALSKHAQQFLSAESSARHAMSGTF
jgi:hypothetical protein